ncbi:MAG: DUF2127 domain-containing protein [Rhizobiales bacterium]|nr:DUF2127 domain-containing protein [Hyphomicrobiales bacterium]MBI3671843.1 DUF2127 domain-containing protein [Hyphomicrobiales bacterium]
MSERTIHRAFEISVLLKGANAVIESAGGILLYLVSTADIATLVRWATLDELAEDPNDFISSHLQQLAQGFSVGSKNFYAFYLLSHGLVKLALVVGLLRGKLWSYPATLVVLALFVAYQFYRYSYTQSLGLIALTILDIVVMALVWHEYRLVRRHLPLE